MSVNLFYNSVLPPCFVCDNNVLSPDTAKVLTICTHPIRGDTHVKDESVVYMVEISMSYYSWNVVFLNKRIA